MSPKNLPRFNSGLLIGLLGIWIHGIMNEMIFKLSVVPDYCCGANIGGGLLILISYAMGIWSLVLIITSYIKPKQVKQPTESVSADETAEPK